MEEPAADPSPNLELFRYLAAEERHDHIAVMTRFTFTLLADMCATAVTARGIVGRGAHKRSASWVALTPRPAAARRPTRVALTGRGCRPALRHRRSRTRAISLVG